MIVKHTTMDFTSLLASSSFMLPGGSVQFLIGLKAIDSPRFTSATQKVAQFSIAQEDNVFPDSGI